MRRFYLRKLTTTKEQEAAQHEAASKGSKSSVPGHQVDRPQFEKRK